MDLNTWLAVAAAFGATLVLRIPFVGSGTSDDWFSWWQVRRSRHSHWVPQQVGDSHVPAIIAPPGFHHWLISRLPPKLWQSVPKWIHGVYDAGSVAILAAMTHAMVRQGSLPETVVGLPSVVVVVAMTATMPSWLPVTARLKGINARSFGLLFYMAWIASVTTFVATENLLALLAGVLCVIAIILGSQMAIQAAAFTVPTLSIVLQSWIPLVTVAIAVLAGLIVPPLGVRLTLRQYVSHKRWYAINAGLGTTAQMRSGLRSLLLLPGLLIRDRRAFARSCVRDQPYVIALYSAPLAIAAIWWVVEGPPNKLLPEDPWLAATLGGLGGSILAFLVTATRRFAHFGQAERYFEYGAPWLAVIGLLWLLDRPEHQQGPLLVSILALHLAGIFVNAAVVRATPRNAVEQPGIPTNLEDCFKHMAALAPGSAVLTIPSKVVWALSSLDGAGHAGRLRYRYPFMLLPGERAFEYMTRDMGGPAPGPHGTIHASFDVPRRSPGSLRKQGLDWLVVERDHQAALLEHWQSHEWMVPEVALETDRYVLYRLWNLGAS